MWITGTVINSPVDDGTCVIATTSGDFTVRVTGPCAKGVHYLWKGATVSLHLNSTPVENRAGADVLVLEPDHVIDVTEVAECITDAGDVENLAILRRFQPRRPSTPVLKGALVNAAFDLLVGAPATTDEELIYQATRSRLLSLAALDVPELIVDSVRCFPHLRSALANWQPQQITVEPHVVSATVGLQGRFDILVHNEKTKSFELIELKSGSAPRRSRTNHLAQLSAYASLFELLHGTLPASCALWYVNDVDNPFRVADPSVTADLLRRAINVRNAIVHAEHRLANRDFSVLRKFTGHSLRAAGPASEFESTFSTVYHNADVRSRTFFQALLSFVVAEQLQTRAGEGVNRSLSDLWKTTEDEKASSSTVIHNLVVEPESSDFSAMHITLRPSERIENTALRSGDLILLHTEFSASDPRTFQVLKATLRTVESTQITISLRNKQVEAAKLVSSTWTVEQDVSDAGLRHLTSGLFRFLRAPERRRASILGAAPPRFGEPPAISSPHLLQQQQRIVERALSARDWFLVQGPPGTGKTSIILRELVRTMVGAGERILVLAYTNRAVNEICDVLAATLPDGSFLRHGTSSGIGAHHVHHSITHIGMALTPSQLAERIRATRCIVSTIHAVHSQPEILEFGRFSTAVVDEASQVLDAHICGILAEVDRHILIGDHAQLPPVIAQPADGLSIHSPLLAQLGLSHLGTSVFERLANCCEVNGWQGALATLEHQGRMHADVMAFPSAAFYGGRLRTVLPWQTEALELPWHNLLPHRACVIEVQSVPEEARVVAVLVEEIIEAMEAAGDDYSVGVISPFRVHNRRIMDLLPESIRSRVLVDTVERFQGSQRDVIIYSTAVANRQELESIRSERHGADRKLNVASTRARHQFVMVGNAEVLKSSASYALALEMLPKLPV